MSRQFVHTCMRVRDPEASQRFYGALGFEPRGRLNFSSAYNVYMGLPGGGDVLELTVNRGREEPYDLGTGYNHMAMTVDDLDVFVPHQANMRITDLMARRLGLPERVSIGRDIETQGNTSAASIPLALDRLRQDGQAHRDDLALLVGFGAGLAYAAQVVALP